MGDLAWRQKNYIGIPAFDLGEHGIAIGSPGSGKTEALLRFAYSAKKVYRKQVIYIDAKGDERQDTPARFFAAMKAAGAQRVRMFPSTYYDGWRGSAEQIYNRLMAVIDYSESSYYGDVAADAVRLAVSPPSGPPKSGQEFVARLHIGNLKALYKNSAKSSVISSLDPDLMRQVQMRYRVFFNAVGETLDGTLSYEDADALYIRIAGFTLRDEAPRLARFLALDYAHYVDSRKPRDVETLLIIDEYNNLRMGQNGTILFEQSRTFGSSVLVASQSVSGLGNQDARNRLLDSANTYVLLRCSDPEPIAIRAGKKTTVRSNWLVRDGGATGQGLQLYEDWKVNPNLVRQQGKGEAFLINSGHAQQFLFARVPVSDEQTKEGWAMIRAEEEEQRLLREEAARVKAIADAQEKKRNQQQKATPPKGTPPQNAQQRKSSPASGSQQQQGPVQPLPNVMPPAPLALPDQQSALPPSGNAPQPQDEEEGPDRI